MPWPETLREGENSARWLDLTSKFERLQTTDWSCWWLMGWVPSPASTLHPSAAQVPQYLEFLGKSKMFMSSHLTSGKRKYFVFVCMYTSGGNWNLLCKGLRKPKPWVRLCFYPETVRTSTWSYPHGDTSRWTPVKPSCCAFIEMRMLNQSYRKFLWSNSQKAATLR